MKKNYRTKYLLFAILAISFLFRWWGMNATDMLGDEAADAFRSVGYVDYLGTSAQTQPIDWYKDSPELPAWTSLSFHDDPPLFFAVQHAFFSVLGDSMRVARLPAILGGTFATWLIYEITRKIFNFKNPKFQSQKKFQLPITDYRLPDSEVIALLAAGIFAIEPATVGIFRTSLIEPVLIFFILLNLLCFLKFLENRRHWFIFGLTLGVVALTKYTGVFLLPVYFAYFLLYERKMLKDWRLYVALAVALVLFTPVLVYNWQMYLARGHFDLQFAYLLKQSTPEWTGLIGKDQAPFSDILKNLNAAYGLPMLAAVISGLAFSSVWYRRRGIKGPALMVFFLISLIVLFIKIGSAERFLQMLGPVMAFFAAVGLWGVWNLSSGKYADYFLKSAVILFLIFELYASVRRNIIDFPSYGIAGLDNYLTQEMGGVESGVIPEADNIHLNKLTHDFAGQKTDKPRALVMIIYNDDVALPTLEWIFYRRFFYHSIPDLFVENFQKILLTNGPDYFKGFTIYFVQSTKNTILNPFKADKTVGAEFEKWLQGKGLSPAKTIYGSNGLEMFRVYKFSL